MSLAETLDPPPRFESVDAFLDWVELQPERWELVDGVAVPIVMMTGGAVNHARISRNALGALVTRLEGGPCEPFGGDCAVFLLSGRVAYPDVSVSCEPENNRGLASPVVVVEVLSPSTEAYDLGDKGLAYRRIPSLRHLVLVRQDRIAVSHFHREAAGDDFTLTDIDGIDGVLALAAVGVDVPLAELYARVDFAG